MSDQVPHDEAPQRGDGAGLGWGFAVLAAVILMILVSWGWGGNGRGWSRDGQLAHMAPPVAGPGDGPATRTWSPGGR
jgi:hypothetical protein